MPARWIMGLALAGLVAAAPPPGAATLAPPSALAQCAAHRPALHGWKALRAHCPGINATFARLHLRGLLPPHWRNSVSSASLPGLAELAHRYSAAPRSALPDAAALRAAARSLAPPAPAPTLWERLRTWLHKWDARLMRQLAHWLGSLAHGRKRARVVQVMLGILAALLTAIVAVAYYLARRAGLFARRPARDARSRARLSARVPDASLEAEPDWTALLDQPSRVLQLLIAALLGCGRLEEERHLTCRELLARARFDTPAQRDDFAHIALLAERARYGPPIAVQVPEPLLRSARALHSQCRALPQRAGRESQ